MAQVNRPLSPHLQVYRWQLHMFLSIMHRMTGSALAVGTLLIAWGLIAVASGPEAYGVFRDFLSSILGQLILFGFTVALMQHLCSGVRHLLMDTGALFELKANRRSGVIVLVCSVSLTALVWAAGYYTAGAF